MAAGNIKIQANDTRIYTLTPEDGAVGNVDLTIPKEGGILANKTYVTNAISAIPAVPDATNSIKGIDYKGLLAEYEVTGSAVTSIDFSGLDINTHKSYRVEIEIYNTSGSTASLSCFVNNDTVETNYYHQYDFSNGTSVTANRQNNATIASVKTTGKSIYSVIVGKCVDKARFISVGNEASGSGLTKIAYIMEKTATVTNITQLTFTSSVASSIGVGSKIRIYRGDV